MRGAWLFSELDQEFPGMGYDKIVEFLYMKAVTYYSPTLEIMSNGREPHDQFIPLLGPDTDKKLGLRRRDLFERLPDP